jgi:glyoxylase-like metal-dependent hydrolase (beta-lactamase superfamily II)
MTRIHTFTGTPDTVPVNAYVVEGQDAVVVVDGTLTVSGGRGLRALVDDIGKPLAGVLVTHAHPDHYGGLVELGDAPVYATAGVRDVIARDDAVKEQILRPMFGDDWPLRRSFPNRTVADGERVELGGLAFTVLDLGPGESPHDSVWILGDDRRTVFSGDQFYGHMHAYLADGFADEWRAHFPLLREQLPAEAVLYPGHGAPAGLDMLDWQERYIARFLQTVCDGGVVDAMMAFLPTDDLRFLMELSIEPVRSARCAERSPSSSSA